MVLPLARLQVTEVLIFLLDGCDAVFCSDLWADGDKNLLTNLLVKSVALPEQRAASINLSILFV
jgi:hypothetical protein